ncbi:hypothetical protein KBD70_02470 [Candidatus Saccharibacteria bacterium]|nr:hypothetical protein [Candidatus Saccharibacteria bacterium]MBP9986230.1 hypothetical protein [Candidatus Saccharibacteria bacterium]
MNKPIVNKANLSEINRFSKNLPQTTILSVSDYEWGEQIAKYIAEVANFDYEVVYPLKDDKINLDVGKIYVKQARELVQKTRTALKKNKVYIIYKASTMNEQAQNAFLKSLEEPNSSTFYILLVNNVHSLLPTVLSRSQILKITPLNNDASLKLIPDNIPANIKQQILFVANGNPLLINKLVNDSSLISQYSAHITTAKSFLTASTYQKLITINKLKDSREDAIATLDALIKILSTTIKTPDKQLLALLNNALNARNDLLSNLNVRLTLIHHLINF